MNAKMRFRKLTAEERLLWSSVARSVTPLPGKAVAEDAETESMLPETVPLARPQTPIPYARARRDPAPPAAVIDRPTRRKLVRGRIGIDARIDLHDRTQAEAHARLLAFLQGAHASGARHVLVITGKGQTAGGVLRRTVPIWLKTQPFAALVSGFDVAARQHGGEGAIYVRLRRSEP